MAETPTWEQVMSSRARMRQQLADLLDPTCPGHGKRRRLFFVNAFDFDQPARCQECGGVVVTD